MLAAVLLIALLLVATPAKHIAEGEKAMVALEYETAAYELMLAATDPTATEAQRVHAHLRAGVAHRILGRDTDARVNFRYVLLRAPSTTLDETTSPKVRLFFESVRQEIDAERAAQDTSAANAIANAQANALTSPQTNAPSNAPASESAGMSASSLAGAVVVALGVVTLIGGAGGVAYAETSLADGSRAGGERTSLRTMGQWSVASAGVGALVAAGGAALFIAGAAP
jgi:hypothetical protein